MLHFEILHISHLCIICSYVKPIIAYMHLTAAQIGNVKYSDYNLAQYSPTRISLIMLSIFLFRTYRGGLHFPYYLLILLIMCTDTSFLRKLNDM